jgi:hypothetical protein
MISVSSLVKFLRQPTHWLGILPLLFLVSCSERTGTPDLRSLDLPSNPAIAFQQQMIGQLTGKQPIRLADGSSILLTSRWSRSERELTVSYLEALILSLGLVPERHEYRLAHSNPGIDMILEPYRGTNVYTVVPATTKSREYVVMGAHYDTGARGVPGAIDNATGMALIASVLKEVGEMPVRNKHLIVVFFDQEEEELIGSKAFAKKLQRDGKQIHTVHTLDMVGWDGDDNREVELEMPSDRLEKLYSKHADRLGIPIYTTQINSTDHFAFIQRGFEAVGISQAYAKRDNSGKKDTPEDVYDLVHFEYLASTTELVFQVIADILTSKDSTDES